MNAKTIATVIVVIGLVTAFIGLITEGLKLYQELPATVIQPSTQIIPVTQVIQITEVVKSTEAKPTVVSTSTQQTSVTPYTVDYETIQPGGTRHIVLAEGELIVGTADRFQDDVDKSGQPPCTAFIIKGAYRNGCARLVWRMGALGKCVRQRIGRSIASKQS